MPVKIGHASIDENGKIHSGKAGDQTGKEVCTRSWYKNSWHTVLRCKDSAKAEIMAKQCENACANKNIGYDQGQRNTLKKQMLKVDGDLSKITVACECDCSSLMTVCAECADIAIPYTSGNAPSTYTMVKAFTSTGAFTALTDSKYLASDKHLKRGDILVKKGHTVMVLENGEYETRTYVTVKLPLLKKTCKGDDVATLQAILIAKGYNCGEIDGSFGTKTHNAVVSFQKAKKLDADGVVGQNTWCALLC